MARESWQKIILFSSNFIMGKNHSKNAMPPPVLEVEWVPITDTLGMGHVTLLGSGIDR